LDATFGHVERDQTDLFGAEEGHRQAESFEVPALEEYSLFHRCLNELRMLGYVLSANLLHVVENHPSALGAVRAADLGNHVGRRVKVLGIPVTDRLHPVATAQAATPGPDGEVPERLMKFLTLGDNTGYADILFWPDALERWNDTLVGQVPFSGTLVEVWGRVSEDWGTFAVEADSVRAIDWLPNQMDFALASRRLKEGMKSYPAYTRGMEVLAA
jgi:DNA polymerase III alpha subunit